MNSMTEAAVTIALAIVGVATVAVLVSKNAQTASVLQAAGSAFNNALAVGVSPVTGNTSSPFLGYPGGNFGLN